MAISSSVTVKFKCGHSQSTDLGHVPAGKRKGHAFSLGKNRVCGKCFKQESEAGREEWLKNKNAQELAEAEVFEEEHELEPITGSDKQLAWGTRARYSLLSAALEAFTAGDEASMSEEEFDETILAPARRLNRASWWINNSDAEPEDLEELVTTAGATEVVDTETENPF